MDQTPIYQQIAANNGFNQPWYSAINSSSATDINDVPAKKQAHEEVVTSPGSLGIRMA